MEPRWYYSLVKSEPNKPPGLFESELLNPSNIIVCQHMKYRKYAKYDSVYDILLFVRNMRFSHNCLYEVVRGKLAHKWYADIDIMLSEGLPEKPKNKKEITAVSRDGVLLEDLPFEDDIDSEFGGKCVMSESETINVVLEVKKALMAILPMIKESDILVASSNDSKKHSYHIVLDRWCLANNKEAKAIYRKVIQLIPEKYRPAIDHSMYKSIQQFRMYNSHKWESTRVKTFRSDLSSWKSDTVVKDDKHRELLYFSAFLLSNISGCSVLPSFVEEEESKKPFEGNDNDLKVDEIKDALELFKDVYSNANCFSYHTHTSRFVLLKRKMASYCSICQRKHDAQHPYLLIVGARRNVYFDCRRNDSNKRLYLGSLGFLEEYEINVTTDSSTPLFKEEIPITIQSIMAGLVATKPSSSISLEKKPPIKQNIVYKYSPDYSESGRLPKEIVKTNEEKSTPVEVQEENKDAYEVRCIGSPVMLLPTRGESASGSDSESSSRAGLKIRYKRLPMREILAVGSTLIEDKSRRRQKEKEKVNRKDHSISFRDLCKESLG
jgi:hypothetical protein